MEYLITYVLLGVVQCFLIEASNDDFTTVVQTANGPVQGLIQASINGRDFYTYYGIPYAKPPTGELRFQAPESHEPWTSTYAATKEPPACLQIDYYNNYRLVGQEDCLFLNVHTPHQGGENEKYPVLVWFHGGAFKRGSASNHIYGPKLLMDKNVLLVAVHYRIGILGFLSTGDDSCSGNMGLKDQNLALKWIQKNIVSFGGDPDRVTIFGQSAGGASVHYHMLSPMSKGLFHRAISQSGTSLCYWAYDEQPEVTAHKVAAIMDCDSDDTHDMIECLRSKPAEVIVRKQRDFVEWSLDDPISPFGPTTERNIKSVNQFLPGEPRMLISEGKFAQVPWMLGFTTHEAALRVSEIVIHPHLVEDINNNFIDLAPIIFDYRHTSKNPTAISKSIHDFYFNCDECKNFLSKTTFDEFLQLYSDRFIAHGVYEGALLHLEKAQFPIYFYQMAYRGRISITSQSSKNVTADYGVSHGDDLMYLFSGQFFPSFNNGEPEHEFREIMLTLWTNFAETGIPTSKNNLRFSWEPFSKAYHQFLDLSKSPSMKTDWSFENRMKFWNQLDLTDTGKLLKGSKDEL